MEDWADEYKVDTPEGTSGAWRIERFTVSEEAASMDRLRGIFRGGRYARQGTYTRLTRNGSLVMSDTHDEISDHYGAIARGASSTSGVFLINGLGLGMVADNILKRNPIIKVRVIEISSDVISLVAPHYRAKHGDRFETIQADAMDYKPSKGERFAGVWHDIWDNICGDNLEEMKTLHRKYGRRTEWQESWCRYQCERGR